MKRQAPKKQKAAAPDKAAVSSYAVTKRAPKDAREEPRDSSRDVHIESWWRDAIAQALAGDPDYVEGLLRTWSLDYVPRSARYWLADVLGGRVAIPKSRGIVSRLKKQADDVRGIYEYLINPQIDEHLRRTVMKLFCAQNGLESPTGALSKKSVRLFLSKLYDASDGNIRDVIDKRGIFAEK